MDLTFENVTKFYGPVIGVNDVSCRIGQGITALFGANGAGKSTLMKLASGQLRPSLGRVLLGGRSAWSTAAKRHLGYMPDVNSFYEEMTGREFVCTLARLHGFGLAEARRRTEVVLEQVGMQDRADRRLGGYSHGMRQRINLAQALVHDPDVLLLDEPMSGIDPGGRRDLGRLLREQAQAGKTVLVSTHLLAEVEDAGTGIGADQILMIARGRVIAWGTLHDIRALLADQPLTVGITCGDARRLAALLVGLPEVQSVEVADQALTLRTRQPEVFFPRLNGLLASERIDIEALETLDAGADAVFSYLERA
jgi:ABC-2 type transport system ATP-binding protein